MDTNLMEINGIVESFKLDILIIEQENFMNIMYNKSEGVLNEAVLHEGFKDVIKELVRRAKEAIHKLAGKVKEILSTIINENKRRMKFTYSGKLDNIDDEDEFNAPDYNDSVEVFNNIKKSVDITKKMIDMVIIDKNKLDVAKMDKCIEILTNKYESSYNNIDKIVPGLVTFSGKSAKTVFKKYDDLHSKFTTLYITTFSELLKYLKEADKQIDGIGNEYTKFLKGPFKNEDIHDIDADSEDIGTRSYKSKDTELSKLLNKYIQFFSLTCKLIFMQKKIIKKVNDDIFSFIIQMIKKVKNEPIKDI